VDETKMPPTLVDTHAHVDYIARTGEDVDAAIARAQAEGVQWLVNPGVAPDRYADVMAMAERFDMVYAALSVHPTDVQDVTGDWRDAVRPYLKHPKLVAIGETGLDYYHDTTYVALQKQFFREALALAQETGLPVIVHDREAHDDVRAILAEFPEVRGVMHCFSGDGAFAHAMVEMGYYVSFAGNVTFKKATDLQEAAQAVPLDRLLIETDSPFLSPMPHRGKPNEPARVRFVAEKIAELRGMSVEALAEATAQNAQRLFFESRN